MGGNYQEVNEEIEKTIVQMMVDLNKATATTPQITIGSNTI